MQLKKSIIQIKYKKNENTVSCLFFLMELYVFINIFKHSTYLYQKINFRNKKIKNNPRLFKINRKKKL